MSHRTADQRFNNNTNEAYLAGEMPHASNFTANVHFLTMIGRPRPTDRVLEIGCGTGAMLHHIRSLGADAVGIDIRGEAIEQARRQYGDMPMMEMTGDRLEFPDGSFDVVVSFDVLEHIPDTDRHLREVRRVLAPAGVYALQTPNLLTNVPWEIATRRSLTRWKDEHSALHTLRGLRRRLRANGFRFKWVDVPIINDYSVAKVERNFGALAARAFVMIGPDTWPPFLRTNMYVVATKR